MITISNLKKSYGKNVVLDNFSIAFDSKGIDIIVGINGSGKTTLLNCITDITPFEKGEIRVDEIDMKEKLAKCKMFYIPSEFYIPEYLSGQEYANFVFNLYKNFDEEVFHFLIDMYHLKPALHKKVSDYSYGMKKKLQISIALAIKVQYVLADEVFNGLDYESYLLTEYLFDKFSTNRKFLLVTHNMDYINRNDQANVYLLNAGSIELVDDVSIIEEIVINQGELKEHYEKINRFFTHNENISERNFS